MSVNPKTYLNEMISDNNWIAIDIKAYSWMK